MATELDNKMTPVVASLLSKFGVTCVVTVETEGEYQPSTGTYTGATSTEHSITSSPPLEFDNKYIDGITILRGDMQIFIKGDLEFTPAIGQKVVVAGSTFRVVGTSPIYSGDLIATWMLHLRK